jgi:hypothetical protein
MHGDGTSDVHTHPLSEGGREPTVRQTPDLGQNGWDEYETTSGEEDARNVPQIGALVLEQLRGGGGEDG